MNQAEDTDLHRAIAAHRAGKLPAAERHYRAFLDRYPEHAGANHNLGLLMAQRGEPQKALPSLRRALESDASQGQYWLSYAKALAATGHCQEALALLQSGRQRGLSGPAFESLLAKLKDMARPDSAPDPATAAERCRQAIAQDPGNSKLHFDLGYALTAQGRLQDAIAAYREAVRLDPDFADAHFRLGSLLSEDDRIQEGFAHYMRRAELIYGRGPAPAPSTPELPHKIKHDREQRDYLAGGHAPPEAPPVAAMFHLEDGSRLAGPAVNPANATPELLERWRSSQPQMVVLENFLMPEALERLRKYCAGSTIWRRIYDAGYIGATPENGFACPLLAQIAEEIRTTYPQILGSHRFRYLGAFKYDSELSTGTNTHADNAAVNINFYIAPDEANLDPESGGMDIWDVSPPNETVMRELNGSEQAAREFLESRKARLTRVPHRANRAVIFKSDLIHKTSDCRFKEGYLNKRINISFLFGDMGG
jgi:tetratricopeptide (TPR) repeat protein